MRPLSERLRLASKYGGRGALVGFIVIFASWFGFLDGASRWNLNLLFSLRGPVAPQTPIVIVSISEDSFDELDMAWPWPRTLHASLLDRISQGHPTAVGLDIVFSEPSVRGSEDDRNLAEAIDRAGHVILAGAMTTTHEASYIKEDMNAPIMMLRERAAGFGFGNFVLDEDAYIRSAELTRTFQGREFPSLALALYQMAERGGVLVRPLQNRQFLINYRGGPRSFLTVPYYQVLRGEVGPETFSGKIVLVGATSPVLHDIYPTPFAPQGDMSGVEIQANVLETLVQGIPLEPVPQGIGMGLALVAGIVSVWTTNRLRPLVAFGAIFGVGLVYGMSVVVAFTKGRLVMEAPVVFLPLMLGYGTTILENFIVEQRKRAMLMQLFSKHVSPEIADAIWQQRDQFTAGGRLRSQKLTATVLFTDLKGFTSISERMDTKALMDWINDYMEVMAQLVMKHGGIVDDYYGDAIKANFGVPFERKTEADIGQEAMNAVECALAMGEELKRLNLGWKTQGLPIVGMRVGICTGEIVAGCIGSAQRLKFTTIGDTVNTASRLESFEKELADPSFTHVPCRILIDESTRGYLENSVQIERVGELSLKGKNKPISVYRVYGKAHQKEARWQGMNLRKGVRIGLVTRVTVSNGVLADALVGNLSVGGIAVSKLSQEFSPGKLSQLHFELPGTREAIQASGTVVWAVQDRAGFAFREMSPTDLSVVEEFVARQG